MAHHLLIPAAGVGRRFGAAQPKQYVQLQGLPLIERTLRRLTSLMAFQSVSVGLAAGDEGWESQVEWRRVEGGPSRADTVLMLLESLTDIAAADDWIWVQDAVRPLVSAAMIERLQQELGPATSCVIAGWPATDTLKRVDDRCQVLETLDRQAIWSAQTPQVCRYRLLLSAMRSARAAAVEVTDEAMALELTGVTVKLVEGSKENIKITQPEDLRLAEFIYTEQENNVGD